MSDCQNRWEYKGNGAPCGSNSHGTIIYCTEHAERALHKELFAELFQYIGASCPCGPCESRVHKGYGRAYSIVLKLGAEGAI